MSMRASDRKTGTEQAGGVVLRETSLLKVAHRTHIILFPPCSTGPDNSTGSGALGEGTQQRRGSLGASSSEWENLERALRQVRMQFFG